MNKFLSRYSGSEIDQLLKSVSNKVSYDDIVTDYKGGDISKVASASDVKALKDWTTNFNKPEWIKELFSKIDDIDLFTVEDRKLLSQLKNGFIGSFQDAAERQTNFPYQSLIGNEVSLLRNKNGLQSLEYYDAVSKTWKQCQLTKTQLQSEISQSTYGNRVVYSFPTSKSVVKLLVKVESGSEFCAFEILCGYKSGNTYSSSFGFIGSSPDMVKVNRLYVDGENVKVELTLPAGSRTTVFVEAEI